ncbi:hypothetical protein TIFTF001_026259 [Ficus carica]|uniref:Peroxisomal membrane protein n=1 Tax=Ficus carica TaxID=3494 RepID=A0AA88IXZ2_FICCA|nr:hypothetical protein TIFTF001_026259 [Ficus carica]
MATLNAIITHGHGLPRLTKSFAKSHNSKFTSLNLSSQLSTAKRRNWVVAGAVTEDQEVAPVEPKPEKDKEKSFLVNGSKQFDAFSTYLPFLGVGDKEDLDKLTSRAINAAIVLGFGTFAITKLFTIDHEYWHGWTLYEVLRYAPAHNWIAYEQALKANPVLAKMMISGVVYAIGDWIAQCYEGKPIFEFERTRMLRSGLVGFALHGSLSHYYYQFCEALFPFEDWWVVPAKVSFDQTVWSAVWNSIYYFVLGLLRFESPAYILSELKATFWPLLTAGWKLWPFAHLVTYGVIPIEQRLLWVDCVELIWVTILSTTLLVSGSMCMWNLSHMSRGVKHYWYPTAQHVVEPVDFKDWLIQMRSPSHGCPKHQLDQVLILHLAKVADPRYDTVNQNTLMRITFAVKAQG